jgi:hypothetical protein
VAIGLELLNCMNDSNVEYFPHGVTTLTIAVSNTDDVRRKLIVRPTNRTVPPDYLAYESEKNGISRGSNELNIIWGGGMTEGYQLDLVPNQRKKIFYLIIHNSRDVCNYSFNIEAVGLDVHDIEICIMATRQINLIPPRDLHDDNNICRMTVDFSGVLTRTSEFEGDLIATYKSRWYGSNLGYTFIKTDYPRFLLKYEVKGQYVMGNITVYSETSAGSTRIATIGGDLERSKIQADLFHFVDDYCVLRIWLFWLNDSFEGNRLIRSQGKAGTRSSVRLDYVRPGQNSPRDTTELRAWKQKVIEVPDAERFDIVINKKTGTVSYIGTDLHWQEVWWYAAKDFVRLEFANLETVPVLITQMPKILGRYAGKKAEYEDPSLKVRENLGDRHVDLQSFDASLTISDADPTTKYPMNTTLGHGIYRKHLPYVVGSPLRPEYSSNDVREF